MRFILLALFFICFHAMGQNVLIVNDKGHTSIDELSISYLDSIHFGSSDNTFYIDSSYNKIKIAYSDFEIVVPMIADTIALFMAAQKPYAQFDIEASDNQLIFDEWIELMRIKNSIRQELRIKSILLDTSQYVSTFEKEWGYYENQVLHFIAEFPQGKNVAQEEIQWLKEQKENHWKKQKYRMGVNFRRLTFGQQMKDVVGTQALPIKAIDHLKQEQNLASFKGKPIVIEFWATWCGPCKKEIPHWNAMVKKYQDDVHFVSIGVKSPWTDWLKMYTKNNAPHRWFIAKEKSQQLTPWNVYFIPRYVIIDADFNVVFPDASLPSKRQFEDLIKSSIDLQ